MAASAGLDSILFAATLAKAAEGLLPRGTPGGSGGLHFSPLSGRSVGAWGCAWLSSEVCRDPAHQAAGRRCRAAAWRLAPGPALLWFPPQRWGPECPVSGPLSAPAKPRGLRGAGGRSWQRGQGQGQGVPSAEPGLGAEHRPHPGVPYPSPPAYCWGLPVSLGGGGRGGSSQGPIPAPLWPAGPKWSECGPCQALSDSLG